MKTFYIYKHTCKITNKVYIGQTCQKNPYNRWLSNGNGYKTQRYFWRAIQKYGWDNFEHTIIQTTDTKDKADILEKMWIYYYKNRCGVYNMTEGGEGVVGPIPWNKGLKGCFTKDTLQKMSDSHKGKTSGRKGKTGFTAWNKGIPWSKETKQKLSESHKGLLISSKHPMYGKHHTDESKQKISLSKKGRKWYNNGTIQGQYFECPEGFILGRLNKIK